MIKLLLRYFIQGILIIVPIGLTFYIVYRALETSLSWIGRMGGITNTWLDPIIFFVLMLVVVLVIGFFGSTFIFNWLLGAFEQLLEKTPLLRIIYSSIKDFLSAVVGGKKRFNQPVLVTLDKANQVQQIGFITQTDLSEMGLPEEKVAVYLPMSYAFSGKLIIVPKENISVLDIPAAEAMKFIVSGGVSEID
jgi:uncharacterized membrane protein